MVILIHVSSFFYAYDKFETKSVIDEHRDERTTTEKHYTLYMAYKKCIFLDTHNIVLYTLKMIIKADNFKVLQYFITFNQLPRSMSQKMFSSRLTILMKINILCN